MRFNVTRYFAQTPPSNIIRVEALKNYCKIYLYNSQKVMMICITLMRVQDKLPAEMFVRVHRSHLINRHHIKRIRKEPEPIIEMMNGECIPISRRKLSSIIR